MRIDLHYDPQPLSEANRCGSQSSLTANSPATPSQAAEDKAELSGAQLRLQALAGQASQGPEIRQERVQSLRAALESGSYAADAREVAGAMLAEMVSFPAA